MTNNLNQAMEKEMKTFYHEKLKVWVSIAYALTAYGQTKEESVERLNEMIEYSKVLAREREIDSHDTCKEG